MNKIEITTPQNVTIEYQLASSIQRIFAQIIDALAFWATFLLLLGALTATNLILLKPVAISFGLLMLSIFVGYEINMETYNNGQSLGKMALGIKVIRIDGESVKGIDAFGRWSFRFIDGFPYLGALIFLIILNFSDNNNILSAFIAALSTGGIIGLIFTISSDKTQRLGDMVAGTAVIRSSKKAGRMSLKHILDLQKTIDYEPKFPAVTQLSNEEMLLVKETSDRYKKHRNIAHEDALKLLAKKIETQLGIKGGKDKQLFFQTLIRDYVFLTR